MAAMGGHGEVVQKLVELKVDVNAQNEVRELVVVWMWCVGVTRCAQAQPGQACGRAVCACV